MMEVNFLSELLEVLILDLLVKIVFDVVLHPFDLDNDEDIDVESEQLLCLSGVLVDWVEMQNVFIPDFDPVN
jgi:hypothetical protein